MNGAPSARRKVSLETFKSASESIGTPQKGMSMFLITRGQFSMIDAVLHVLGFVKDARISIWTWTIAEYELDMISRLMSQDLSGATLIMDPAGLRPSMDTVRRWQASFGPQSVRFVRNHAKIATIEGSGLKFLLRGSMNLNFNPRFEQMDITEGGEDFDLVRSIEEEIPVVKYDVSHSELVSVSRLGEAFDQQTLDMFAGLKKWTP